MTKSLTLIIGDKNFSSWSMRPWVALKASGLKFREKKILLDRPNSSENLKRGSPSGKVPVLIHGSTTVWDSLAICEYLGELAPELWPQDAATRATARSYMAEMHASFHGMRTQLSMDIQLRIKLHHLTSETIGDIRRILQLWEDALAAHGGPFLFGDFGMADAYFAPVTMRFQSYGIQIRSARCRKYLQRVLAHPAVSSWANEAMKEKLFRMSF